MSTHNQPPETPDGAAAPREVSFFTIIFSVFSSFFGVQKDVNRRRDFTYGKPWHFIAAGIIFVVLFLAALWAVVQYLLATTPTTG